MIVGVLLAGLAGLLFSPIAARLRGIYLGVASLGLVFIGQHVLNTWTSVTGGFNGRAAPELLAVRLPLRRTRTRCCSSPACRSGEAERLWYLGLVAARRPPTGSPATCCAAAPAARCRPCGTARSRPSVMGVNVQRYKGRVVPGQLDVRRAVRGAVRPVHRQHRAGVLRPRGVDPVPRDDRARRPRLGRGSGARRAVRQRHAAGLPEVRRRRCRSSATAGEGGLAAGEAARFLYGVADRPGDPLRTRRSRRSGRTVPAPRPGPRPARRSRHGADAAATSSSTTDVPSDRPAQGSST